MDIYGGSDAHVPAIDDFEALPIESSLQDRDQAKP